MAALDSFRTVRWFRTLNLVLQAVLCVTLFGGLNYLALHHPVRYDLTRRHRYSLSPETLAYLRDLNQPVRVVVTLTDDTDNPDVNAALADVRGLLREYVYATEGNHDPRTGHDGRVTVEYLDVYQRRRDADQLGIAQANAIVFLSGSERHVVTLDELYHVVNREPREFLGEQAFTAAILDVSSPEQKKIYFLTGHGEMAVDESAPGRGVSALADELRLRNFAVAPLDVSFTHKVPDDAALVIAAGPDKVDAFTQEQLRQYLDARAGRLLLFLAPEVPPGLDDLLSDWGVWVDDDVIRDSNRDEITENGDLRVRFLAPHPITQALIDMRNVPLLVGLARSMRPEPVHLAAKDLILTTLAATSTTAWGEVNPRQRPDPPTFIRGVDIRGLPQLPPANRLGVIIASERPPPTDNLPYSVSTGRVVVFGSTDFVVNNRFLALPGNQNIVLNAVNWAVGRAQLNVPARAVERFKLSLSAQELVKLRYCILFLVPGAAALLGLLVYWGRRT